MTEALVDVLAAVVIAGSANTPVKFEQVCNYVFNNSVNYSRQVQTVTDVNGVGAALIAQGATDPATLERIGTKALTYPYTRAVNNVLDWPTSS